MAKRKKATKFMTSKQLQILPEERQALIAFVKAPSRGRIIEVNGQSHYYSQAIINNNTLAANNACNTAGCVAGYVFAHVTHVQKRSLREAHSAHSYIERATDISYKDGAIVGSPVAPLLYALYIEGGCYLVSTAKKVVKRMLTVGQVAWPANLEYYDL